MEITTLQIVLVFIVACIAGMGSILDEFQFQVQVSHWQSLWPLRARY